MKKKLLVGFMMIGLCFGPAGAVELDLICVQKIWSGEQYSSFTDLIHYRDQFFCVFREGKSHASPGGTIRVLRSVTGEEWETVAVLSHPELDLRDAHVSEMPDGRLMMTGGTAHYRPNESGRLVACDFQTFTAFSNDGINWSEPNTVADPGSWLWRSTWFAGTAYGIAYRFPESIRLLATLDGLSYNPVGLTLLDTMAPNEGTIRFEADGQAYCLLRREGEKTDRGGYTRVPALLGRSEPPYEEWTWQDLGLYLGGPNFIQIGTGEWIAGGRTRIGPARMTLLHLEVERGAMEVLHQLPSGGDCSYPGMVWHNDTLWVSYYSTHEGKAEIYLAQLRLASRSKTEEVSGVQSRPLPDFGLMLNDDGDYSFTDRNLEKSEANLRQMIRSLERTSVRTLVYNVATGTDIMLYPSKVSSVYGWRKTTGETKPPWDERMPIFRTAAEAGVDAVRIAAEEAKAIGLYFIPSFRMNDAHYAVDPMNNPLTGEFWVKHHEQFEFGQSPLPEVEMYKHLLDFSHAEVREYRLAVIHEVISRYSDIMEGLQLDFMRNPILFPTTTAATQAQTTEMISAVRASLDEAGRKEGRFLSLHVRVPPSLKSCKWAGLDIEKWLGERLVDVVIPSQGMTLSYDMPVDSFIELARPVGATVYPVILTRTQFSWPFLADPDASDYTIPTDRRVRPEQVRGAAANYMAMGAAGVEMYNFNLPPYAMSNFYDYVSATADPWDGDRVHAVTPAHWIDYTDTFEDRKQIPANLNAGVVARVTMRIGDAVTTDAAEQRILRLGLYGVDARSANLLVVALNGVEIYRGPVAEVALPVTGTIGARGRKSNPKPAQTYVQWPVDLSILHPGLNEIAVALELPDPRAIAQLVEVQLAVFDSEVVK